MKRLGNAFVKKDGEESIVLRSCVLMNVVVMEIVIKKQGSAFVKKDFVF
jgi:hypothetical protein